jgi:hypothetical protein
MQIQQEMVRKIIFADCRIFLPPDSKISDATERLRLIEIFVNAMYKKNPCPQSMSI